MRVDIPEAGVHTHPRRAFEEVELGGPEFLIDQCRLRQAMEGLDLHRPHRLDEFPTEISRASCGGRRCRGWRPCARRRRRSQILFLLLLLLLGMGSPSGRAWGSPW